MPNSLKPTNRHAECPVCADTSGKCRTLEGSPLILCMTEQDARKGEVLNGYTCVTKNQTSQWGSFLPFNEATKSDSADYAARRAEREVLSRQRRQLRSISALSQAELGQNNAQLVSQLHLAPGDKLNLIERGLSSDDCAPFVSIKPWQSLSVPLAAGTPGAKGTKLLSPYAGYLCPTFNFDGDILAFQIRNANKGEGQPKYPWLSAKSAPAKLGNDEQPITFVHGATDAYVNLCEGILKPYVAAKLHGQAFIGAAGGNFASSPNQLKNYLEKAQPFEVVLCPDGGALDNPQVMGEYAKLADLVKGFGYSLKVRWYGQFEKVDAEGNGTDVDEISSETFEASELLSWEKYRSMAAPKKPKRRPGRLTATEGFYADYGYLPNYEAVLFPAMKSKRLIFFGSDCGTGKTRLIERYAEWLRANADHEIPVVSFAHRTVLGEAQGEAFGVPFKTELSEFGDGLGLALTLDSAHPKSAIRYNGAHTREHTLVVCDEADQIIDHNCHSQTAIKRVRTEVIENFVTTVASAQQAIFMSAGLADRHVALLAQSVGASAEDCLVIVNTHKRDMGIVNRCESPAEAWYAMDTRLGQGQRGIVKLSGAKTESIYSTKTAIAMFGATKKILVLDHQSLNDPSNPQTYFMAETLVRGTGGAYACEVVATPKGIVSKQTEQRLIGYISHPNPSIRDERQTRLLGCYDLVLYTNAVGSGVSLEQGGFDFRVQIENGAGSIDDCMQSTARYRPTDAVTFVYAKPVVPAPYGNGSSDPLRLQAGKDRNWNAQQAAIAKARVSHLPDNDLLVGGNLGQLWRGYSLQSEAERNSQASSYGDSFFDLLTESNYQVRPAFIPEWAALAESERKEYAAMVKAARDDNAKADDEETSDRDVDNADLQALSQKRQRTATESQQIKKLRAMERYGIAADAVTPELIKAEKKGLYSRLENRYYLERSSSDVAERDAAKVGLAMSHGRTWRDDLLKDSQGYKVQLQRAIGLDKFIAHIRTPGDDGPVLIHEGTPQVVELVTAMAKYRDALKDAFRTTVGKKIVKFEPDGSKSEEIHIDRPMAVIQTLLKRLELNVKAKGRITIDGKQLRTYHFVDLLETKTGTLIDFSKFTQIKREKDQEMIIKLGKISEANTEKSLVAESLVSSSDIKKDVSCDFLPTPAETPVNTALQPKKALVAKALVSINRVCKATNAFFEQASKPDITAAAAAVAEKDLLLLLLEECQSAIEYSEIRARLEKTYHLDFNRDVWPQVSPEAQRHISRLCAPQ